MSSEQEDLFQHLETPLEALMSKREMLTKFSADYAAKHTSLQQEMQQAQEKLDEAIAEEEAEVQAIAQVKDQLDDLALSKDLQELEDSHTAIVSKFKTYMDIVDANDKRAAVVLASIQESQPLITEINKTIAELCSSIAEINNALAQLRNKPKVSPPTPL